MRARAAGLGCAAALLAATVSGCGMIGLGGNTPPAKIDGNSREAALADARSRSAMYPSEPYWPYRMGQVYAAMDSTAQATTALRAALARNADYAPALSLLSRIQYDTGQHSEAIAMLDGSIASHTDAPDELRAALALHLDAVDDIAGAETMMATCTGASGDVYAARAYVSLRGNAPGTALAIAQAAVDANGKSAVNQNNYGVALLHAGKPMEAREAFRKALERDPNLPGALYNMSIVEVFYFFDENVGREWFDRYTQVALDDPDDLASVFKVDMTRLSRPAAD
jgi:tetratricopeptide (TPR) repeat protein